MHGSSRFHSPLQRLDPCKAARGGSRAGRARRCAGRGGGGPARYLGCLRSTARRRAATRPARWRRPLSPRPRLDPHAWGCGLLRPMMRWMYDDFGERRPPWHDRTGPAEGGPPVVPENAGELLETRPVEPVAELLETRPVEPVAELLETRPVEPVAEPLETRPVGQPASPTGPGTPRAVLPPSAVGRVPGARRHPGGGRRPLHRQGRRRRARPDRRDRVPRGSRRRRRDRRADRPRRRRAHPCRHDPARPRHRPLRRDRRPRPAGRLELPGGGLE